MIARRLTEWQCSSVASSMAASERQDHIPGFPGGDLPEKERIAYEEAHDADIPSNEGIVVPAQARSTDDAFVKKNSDHDAEKADERSSNSSAADNRDIEKAEPIATATEENQEVQDPNIVFWDGPDDPANPQNWSPGLKWGNVAVLSIITLLTPLASSMFAPGVPRVMADFDVSSQLLATFVVSVYLLGFALGPLIVAPLSELYGRLLCYHVGNLGFIVFTIACALATNMNMLVGFRFLQGCWGVVPLTIGGGTIADLMAPEKRGGAMAIWAMGPLLGPVIGPVVRKAIRRTLI